MQGRIVKNLIGIKCMRMYSSLSVTQLATLIQNQRFQEALDLFKQTGMKDEKATLMFFEKSCVYEQLRQHAINYFQSMGEGINELSMECKKKIVYNMAIIYALNKDFEKMIQALHLMKQDTSTGMDLGTLMEVLMKQNDTKEIIPFYVSQVIKHENDSHVVSLLKKLSPEDLDYLTQSISEQENIDAIKPKYLIDILFSKKCFHSVALYFSKLTKTYPKKTEFHWLLIVKYLEHYEFNDALAVYESFIIKFHQKHNQAQHLTTIILSQQNKSLRRDDCFKVIKIFKGKNIPFDTKLATCVLGLLEKSKVGLATIEAFIEKLVNQKLEFDDILNSHLIKIYSIHKRHDKVMHFLQKIVTKDDQSVSIYLSVLTKQPL
ncbi:hypothetical protein ROZALSC1DRAFT_30882, partial [Rozella allomycis CSF55]